MGIKLYNDAIISTHVYDFSCQTKYEPKNFILQRTLEIVPHIHTNMIRTSIHVFID